MKPTVTVVKLENNVARMAKAATGDQLVKALLAGGHVIEANAKINANRVFSSKATNTLAGSIITEVDKAERTNASVNVGPTVVYGRIQELGGVISAVTARFLHFFIDGVEIFTKEVTLPPRPYLRPAADENHDQIVEAISVQLKRNIENGG